MREHVQHTARFISECPRSPRVAAWLWLLMVGLLAGSLAGGDALDLATLAPTATRPPAPTATPLPAPTAEAVVTDTGTITLSVWYPEHLDPLSDLPGGAALAEQYRAFGEMYPDVRIAGRRFKASGPGGLLDYLLATSKVLPVGLPDLVLLDLRDLPQAAALLQPLDGLWESEPWGDYYPAAARQSRVEGRLLAVPYELDIRLLAYDAKLAEMPAAWPDGEAWPAPYLLPLGSPEAAAQALLLQYPEGGDLDEAGRLVLDEGALAAALEYYRARHEQELLHTAALTTTNLADCWELFVGGKVDLTETTAHLVLADEKGRAGVRCAPLPTRGGIAAPVLDGWAWAVLTGDDYRQQAASALISWLMDEDNLAARCVASGYLPSRQGALALIGDSPCLPTCELLLGLESTSVGSLDAALAPLLLAALQDVLAGNQSSAQAAAAVLAAATPRQVQPPE